MTAPADVAQAAADHTFGVNILAARVAMALTPVQLAVRAGVARRVVGAVECGRGCQPADAVELARAIGVPLEQLLRPAGSAAS